VEANLGVGVGALALVAGFPLLLLGVIWLLARLEAWMLRPYERAALIADLLEHAVEAEEVELGVARLVAEVTDRAPAPRERGRVPS